MIKAIMFLIKILSSTRSSKIAPVAELTPTKVLPKQTLELSPPPRSNIFLIDNQQKTEEFTGSEDEEESENIYQMQLQQRLNQIDEQDEDLEEKKLYINELPTNPKPKPFNSSNINEYPLQPLSTQWEGQTEEYKNLSALFKQNSVDQNLKQSQQQKHFDPQSLVASSTQKSSFNFQSTYNNLSNLQKSINVAQKSKQF
eukprot:TRINITY_DN5096_c0_g1_i1.p2 TRINITY_DN5096_c0_g1~~TRINITY_DN5096_c0_g1_i1.p2  ORF type:complete len:199 (-),score=21.09 TRINITY_DN5096_c0_g1_i1:34-630(-)